MDEAVIDGNEHPNLPGCGLCASSRAWTYYPLCDILSSSKTRKENPECQWYVFFCSCGDVGNIFSSTYVKICSRIKCWILLASGDNGI